MWIQVRTMDGKRSAQIDKLSKLTKIEELRDLVFAKFGVSPPAQRLFFRGKQLENGYKLYDYDVGLNDIVQLLERTLIKEDVKPPPSKVKENDVTDENLDPNVGQIASSDVKPACNEKEVLQFQQSAYQIGHLVDVQDSDTGAWFEAKVKQILPLNSNEDPSCENNSKASYKYVVHFDDYNEEKTVVSEIRPRARKFKEWDDIAVNDMVMVNYNIDKPSCRGFWYDSVVLEKKVNRKKFKELIVRLILGAGKTLEPCRIKFVEEIFLIEKPGSESGPVDEENKRATEKQVDCAHCSDNPRRKCKECGCHVCGEKKDFDKTLLCDECNLPFHTFCLDPPLESLPDDDDWYCPLCRTDKTVIVKAGEELKVNKKKAKMKSATSDTSRDWGKGMACVGRSKICTIVPSNHVGPIPGVPVGSLWKFRVQVSEAGVHRPHVSGIHGKESEGAYSIVLSGGYEDDEDNGDEFTYTGSGGRDLSGNKRTAEQSCDQVLRKNNLALAKTCSAKIDAKNGAESSDWKKSKPIRVVRNYKGAKHSEYAPEEGNRYDGLYKIAKYWPDKGKSGFIVWRYLFRRDDPEPAPWSKRGQKKIKELGITMQYPDGYLENQANKNDDEKKSNSKRKLDEEGSNTEPKKSKKSHYTVDHDVISLIGKDERNTKFWNEALQDSTKSQKAFFDKVQELFACVCCQELVYQPVSTTCGHNVCKACLGRSFKADIFTCPVCRADLGKGYDMTINSHLADVLQLLFPGYGNVK